MFSSNVGFDEFELESNNLRGTNCVETSDKKDQDEHVSTYDLELDEDARGSGRRK